MGEEQKPTVKTDAYFSAYDVMLDSVRYLKVAYFHRGMAATTKAEETWWDEKFLILNKLPTELLDSDPEELLQVARLATAELEALGGSAGNEEAALNP